MKKVTRIEEGNGGRELVVYSGTFPSVTAFSKTKKVFARKNNGRFPTSAREFTYDTDGIYAAANFVGIAISEEDIGWILTNRNYSEK